MKTIEKMREEINETKDLEELQTMLNNYSIDEIKVLETEPFPLKHFAEDKGLLTTSFYGDVRAFDNNNALCISNSRDELPYSIEEIKHCIWGSVK